MCVISFNFSAFQKLGISFDLLWWVDMFSMLELRFWLSNRWEIVDLPTWWFLEERKKKLLSKCIFLCILINTYYWYINNTYILSLTNREDNQKTNDSIKDFDEEIGGFEFFCVFFIVRNYVIILVLYKYWVSHCIGYDK